MQVGLAEAIHTTAPHLPVPCCCLYIIKVNAKLIGCLEARKVHKIDWQTHCDGFCGLSARSFGVLCWPKLKSLMYFYEYCESKTSAVERKASHIMEWRDASVTAAAAVLLS
jgi:hypothetical protein